MTEVQRMEAKRRQDLERLKSFRLLDDDFMTKCFEDDPAAIELVLRIILDKPDLVVIDVRTQVLVKNLLHRSVYLDILATDSEQRRFNVEIQRDDKGAGFHRGRYHSSMMDTNLLEKGEDFDSLPDTYVIFITERDVIGRGQAVYRVERYFDTGEPFHDGTHIIYVNGENRDNTPIGKLMHDFACTNPQEMHYDVLAERVRFYKESKEGIAAMCKVMEDIWHDGVKVGHTEGRREGIEEGAKNRSIQLVRDMLTAGKYSLDEISTLSGLPISEVQKIQTTQYPS